MIVITEAEGIRIKFEKEDAEDHKDMMRNVIQYNISLIRSLNKAQNKDLYTKEFDRFEKHMLSCLKTKRV